MRDPFKGMRIVPGPPDARNGAGKACVLQAVIADAERPHGTERDRRMEHEVTTAKYVAIDGDELELPAFGRDATVVERWCFNCQAWITCGRGGIVEHMICIRCKASWKDPNDK